MVSQDEALVGEFENVWGKASDSDSWNWDGMGCTVVYIISIGTV